MIIACSATALARIQQACFRRVAKDDGRPLVVNGKTDLARARSAIAANADANALIWNLDFVEAPVVSGGEAIGTVLTGYLYQHEAQFTVVLNSLDDGDLCRIGAVARNALRIALADFAVCPQATEDYLDSADALAEEVAQACDMRFAYPHEAPADKTLVVANANRSAASGLSRTRAYHETFLYGEDGARVSHEPVDRYACYRLNERRAQFKQPGGGKCGDYPFLKMRALVGRFASASPVTAVELKLKLIDDGFPLRRYPDYRAEDAPECWRTIVVPIDAPLSWVHRIIQKTFNWYDYHLHRFSFLDFDTREAFEELFSVECGIERFGEDPLAVRQAAYDAVGGHERFKRLTRLDDKWLMRSFAPYAEEELIHEDFPQATLPEDMPIGLALFGSGAYEALMGIEHLERDADRRKVLRRYCASLREAMAKKAAKVGMGVGGAKSTAKSAAAHDPAEANALFYNYDFGDDWELSIEALHVRQVPLGDMPRVLDGAGHTPPEDCGGIGGFRDVIAAYELTEQAKSEGGERGVEATDADIADAADEGADELAEAEDLMAWARNAVGWRPFEGTGELADVFDQPGRM